MDMQGTIQFFFTFSIVPRLAASSAPVSLLRWYLMQHPDDALTSALPYPAVVYMSQYRTQNYKLRRRF
jgi:hypothetical protein